MPVIEASPDQRIFYVFVHHKLLRLTVAEARAAWALEQDGTLTIQLYPGGAVAEVGVHDDWTVCSIASNPQQLCATFPAEGYDVTLIAYEFGCPIGGGIVATPLVWAACPAQLWHWSFTDDTLDDTNVYNCPKPAFGTLGGGWLEANNFDTSGLNLTTPFPPFTAGTSYNWVATIRSDSADGPVSFYVEWYTQSNGAGLLRADTFGSVGTSAAEVSAVLVAPGSGTVYVRWGVTRTGGPASNNLAVSDVAVYLA